MKVAFSVGGAGVMLLGMGWLFFPEVMFLRWDVQPDPAGVMKGRRYGVVFIATGIMLWLCRKAPRSPALTAVLAGSTISTAALGVVTMAGLLGGTLGPAAWVSFGAEFVLAGFFGYYLSRALTESS